MTENLVIVESPAKAKTIGKFLGKDFTVMSSYGHIRDLEKKGLGIDVENSFAPLYEISSDKKKLVAELRKAVKKLRPFGSHPMRTAREKPLRGIWQKC